MDFKKIGEWVFILGVILAIVLGFLPSLINAGTAAMLLVVFGALVGFLNITEKEVKDFLLASVGLLIAGAAGLGDLPVVGDTLGPILLNIATFVAPAVVIVALKIVFDLAKK